MLKGINVYSFDNILNTLINSYIFLNPYIYKDKYSL